MNIFITFIKFLDWIVAIWVRLARFIEENGGLRFWKGGVTTKMKYIISLKKKKLDPGEFRPPCTKMKYIISFKKKKIGPGGVQAPLGPHLGPSLQENHMMNTNPIINKRLHVKAH